MIKKIIILSVSIFLLATTGLVINSKAGDEELSYGYFWQASLIQKKATYSSVTYGAANVGASWRADCVALKGDMAGPSNKQTTQWFHARDIDANILGYEPRAFMAVTTLATILWQYDGNTCKRGGGPEK